MPRPTFLSRCCVDQHSRIVCLKGLLDVDLKLQGEAGSSEDESDDDQEENEFEEDDEDDEEEVEADLLNLK